MDWNPEIESDAMDADELESLWQKTCNGFAFDYIESHENAVVKDALIEAPNESEHCFVFDADLNATIDPTLGQFDGCPDGGVWEGDHHPYAAEFEEIYEWDDRSEFNEHYSQWGEMENPFYC